MKALLLLVLITPTVMAADVTIGLLPDQPGDIAHLFRIENLDHEAGTSVHILVNLTYNVSVNGTTVTNGTSAHIINKYTTNTPGVELYENFTVCAHILTNTTDPDLANNQGCWDVPPRPVEVPFNTSEENQTAEPQEEPDCTIVTITGLPIISDDAKQLTYRIEPWKTHDEVSYWIEDARGNMIKEEITTSTNRARTYTPHISKDEQTLIIKAQRNRDGCDLSSTQAAVTILKEEEQEEEDVNEDSLTINDYSQSAHFGETISAALTLTKADNRKESIQASVKDGTITLASTKAKIKNSGPYEFELAISIPSDPHCKKEEGEYALVIAAVGEEIALPVTLTHHECLAQYQEPTEIITSFYTQAQNYAAQIILRGRTLQPVNATLCKEERTALLQGQFTINATPTPGNNTYYLITENETRALSFFLRQTTTTPTLQAAPTLQGHYDITPRAINQTPGQELITTTSPNYLFIGGLIISAALITVLIKRKDLRRNKHSEKHAQPDQKGD